MEETDGREDGCPLGVINIYCTGCRHVPAGYLMDGGVVSASAPPAHQDGNMDVVQDVRKGGGGEGESEEAEGRRGRTEKSGEREIGRRRRRVEEREGGGENERTRRGRRRGGGGGE